MYDAPLDVVVGDGGLGSLVAGYLLAAGGRTVGVVDSPATAGTTAVSVVAARRIEPLRDLVDSCPVVARRSAVVLQPEGGLRVEMASERLRDAGNAVALVHRSSIAARLVDAIRGHGGLILPATSSPTIGASGTVAWARAADDAPHPARCSMLGGTEVERLFGMLEATPTVPAWVLEAEWTYDLEPGDVRARFAFGEGTAEEWWLYGDPFDGDTGFRRLRAFGDALTVSLILPVGQVLSPRIAVTDLGDRLRSHPSISPLLAGAVPTGVTARTVAMDPLRVESVVGDGWVSVGEALPTDVAALTTEIETAAQAATAIGAALSSPRVTAARLAGLPARLRRTVASASTVPFGPIDGWADELVIDPARLVDGGRLLADRFAAAR